MRFFFPVQKGEKNDKPVTSLTLKIIFPSKLLTQ